MSAEDKLIRVESYLNGVAEAFARRPRDTMGEWHNGYASGALWVIYRVLPMLEDEDDEQD